MKTHLKSVALAVGIMAVLITGCKREDLNPSNVITAQDEIQALVAQTESEQTEPVITFDEVSGVMAAVNEGVAPDYQVIPEDLDADETSPNAGVRSRKPIRDHSFMRCLRNLHLDSTQRPQVKRALAEYHDCKTSALKRAAAIHHQLQVKYRDLAQQQMDSLKDSTITRAEYKARINRIQQAFQKELHELQLREKLGDALKACHDKFLRALNGILSDRQWKAFVACYRR